MILRALDLVGQGTLSRRYARDGHGVVVRARITPDDTVDDSVRSGVQCVIDDRETLNARATDALKMFDELGSALGSCRTLFNEWHQGATCCQEIGSLTSRSVRQTDATNERLFAWPPLGCQGFLENDQKLDVQVSAIFQLVARFVTCLQDARAQVCYLTFPVQVTQGQCDPPPEETQCDDGKISATQVAARAQAQSHSTSAKSRAEK